MFKAKACGAVFRKKGGKSFLKKDKYNENVFPQLDNIKLWCAQRLTSKQIAQRLGISCQTLKKYKEEHSELASAMRCEYEPIIKEVEEALVKKAKGYTYTEIKTVDKGDRIETSETQKEVPPDLSAISFLLRNCCPEKWSDKPTAENNLPAGGGVVILPEIIQDDAEVTDE